MIIHPNRYRRLNPALINQVIGKAQPAPDFGPIHFWPMNEGTGAVLHDSIGTADLTFLNGAWQTAPGLSTPVALFNGTNTVANASAVVADMNFNGLEPWTVAFWCYLTANGCVISTIDPSFNGGWEIGQGQNGSFFGPFAGCADGASQLLFSECAITGMSPSTATFVVASYDGSNTLAGLNMYFQGVQQGLSPFSDNLTPPCPSTYPLHLGMRSTGGEALGGSLAYMRIWNKVLTQAQITTLYGAGPV
jgi:hypothetical protein